MVAQPTFDFAFPSIHDGILLGGRIYSPPHSILTSERSKWAPRAAIVAHPYAPMGGSYDDNVVLTITETLLKQNLVVGTFNFR